MSFYSCAVPNMGMSCAAISNDRAARPGTWKKYFAGRFDEPGLGGQESALPGLTGFRGALFSVAFDPNVGAWLGWGRSFTRGGLFVTASRDLVHWARPVQVFGGEPGFFSFLAGGRGTAVITPSIRLYYVTGVVHGSNHLEWRAARIQRL
jgi:hypothetical protein